MRKLSGHLSYANVMSTLAVFMVIGGGAAYAANTVFSSDIVDGEVKEADIGTAAVREDEIGQAAVATAELKNDAVTTGKVLNETLVGNDILDNSLKGVDIDESTLSSIGGGGPAGGDLTGSYPDPEIAPNAVGTSEIAFQSVTGSDVDASTLGQVPSALTASVGGIGRHAGNTQSCDPESPTFVTCVSVSFFLPARSRVLIVGSVDAETEVDSDTGVGTCRAFTDQTGVLTDSQVFPNVGDFPGDEQVPVTTVTPALGPGTVTFGIECNQDSLGAITYRHSHISAVALSPN
jgi:hypothetical protein